MAQNGQDSGSSEGLDADGTPPGGEAGPPPPPDDERRADPGEEEQAGSTDEGQAGSGPEDGGEPWEQATVAMPTVGPTASFDEGVSAFDLLPVDPGPAGGLSPDVPGAPRSRDGAVPASGGIHVPDLGPGPETDVPGASRSATSGPETGTWPFTGLVTQTGPISAGPTRREIRFVSIVVAAALAVLVGIFFLGIHLGTAAATQAEPVPTVTATPKPQISPLPTLAPTGPVAAWNTLAGGECFTPFTSPWDEHFTIVDCATPHQAQLVAASLLLDPLSESYPGATKVAAAAQKVCGASGVIDLAAAADDTGVQVQASYPADARQWDSGARAVYCFATLSSGDSITGSIAGPGAGTGATGAATPPPSVSSTPGSGTAG